MKNVAKNIVQAAEAPPALKARIAGGLWLIVIVAASFALVVVSRLIVRNDPVATATNILANESLFRLTFVADFVAGLCYLGVTLLLYELLKPVSRSLATLSALFGLVGLSFSATYYLSRLAPLVLLGCNECTSVFTPSQLQAMALLSLKLHGLAFSISMVFFGLQCLIVGYLIVRSRFLPSIPGVLLAIGGTGYLVASFSRFLSPSVGAVLLPIIGPAGLLGEGSVTLWLLFKGVNVPRWTEQAGRPGP